MYKIILSNQHKNHFNDLIQHKEHLKYLQKTKKKKYININYQFNDSTQNFRIVIYEKDSALFQFCHLNKNSSVKILYQICFKNIKHKFSLDFSYKIHYQIEQKKKQHENEK